jgi:hypothetical protein
MSTKPHLEMSQPNCFKPVNIIPGNPIKEHNMTLEYNEFWQTKARGDNDSEYQIYLSCADDGKGIDITSGSPLKTYDEWLNS